MQIQLTLAALEKLIELDPDFEVTIRQAVVEAFLKKHYIKAVEHNQQLQTFREEARKMAREYVDEAIRERSNDRSVGISIEQNRTRIREAAHIALKDALQEILENNLQYWGSMVISEVSRAVNQQVAIRAKAAVHDLMNEVSKNILEDLAAARKSNSAPPKSTEPGR